LEFAELAAQVEKCGHEFFGVVMLSVFEKS
jgi:hypothetical protein